MKIVHDRDRFVAIGPPGQPAGCRGRVRETNRLEWRVTDPGTVADLLKKALSEYALPLSPHTRCGPAGTHCGAAVLLSAAACNLLAGRPPGPASPATGVPDLVVVEYEHAAAAVALPGEWSLGPWRRSWTRERHAAAVELVRHAIGRGDVYQVNVVGHHSAPFHGDPLGAMLAVCSLPGARYAGALAGDNWTVACASPESLVTITGDRVETRPIKGTRPATETGRTELLGSAKERAEHVMIVDLERNDLSRVARTGSVHVPELFAIRRWCGLWQAESVVRGTLAGGVGITDLLAALCPGGSVTGAPKLAAIDQIAALEPVGRGPSMGVFGYVTPYRIDLGLTIRTVAFDGDTVHLWAGGGITWDSDPYAEVAEAEAKARPLMTALAGPVRSPRKPVATR
jgi:para-aminobenzoate synthetase component 1